MTKKDLKCMAEDIGDLHYESLIDFFAYLGEKLNKDATKDLNGGRKQIAEKLFEASEMTFQAGDWMHEVWDICKPYMEK